jgi:hypothetical protein
MDNMELLYIIILLICMIFAYMVGRFSNVNKALEKQWPDQKGFHEWKLNQEGTWLDGHPDYRKPSKKEIESLK